MKLLIMSIRHLEETAVPDTALLYDRVKTFIPPMEWGVFADDIDAILALKRAAQRRPAGA